jgi:hypothetical protein
MKIGFNFLSICYHSRWHPEPAANKCLIFLQFFINFRVIYISSHSLSISYFFFRLQFAGVTTMLNFFTTSNTFRSTLPVVSNLTAMNVWDGVCMCFIYASLLEFVCVNYVGRKRPLHNVVYRPGENPVTQVGYFGIDFPKKKIHWCAQCDDYKYLSKTVILIQHIGDGGCLKKKKLASKWAHRDQN